MQPTAWPRLIPALARQEMYFWRIGRLKEQLRAGPLDQRATLAYLLATLLLYTITTAAPGWWNAKSEPVLIVDWLTYGATIILVGTGTYAAYRANGGRGGSDFPSRYFALGWVLFIRLAAMLFLPAMALLFAAGATLGAFHGEDQALDSAWGWAGAGVGILFEAVYYLRLVRHLGQVASAKLRRTPLHMRGWLTFVCSRRPSAAADTTR